ncbi:hypothetical protein COLO4_38229 [Corchorus olitorius]|uniref:F-box domain-containing protein n=1 Tax=Corchorus olitorius TaxID=93759 RepID=A0A1R3FW72_9ROSI|nr:hypothetical protein COLO4_38229 [Corchorus olitorius]
MEVLPNEILVNILVRLPVKLVFQCKCVSKEWNGLISTESFRQLYVSSKHAVSGFLFYSYRPLHTDPCMRCVGPVKVCNKSYESLESQELKSLDLLNGPGYVLASSKGLVLVSRNPMSYYICLRSRDEKVRETCQDSEQVKGLSPRVPTYKIETYSSESGKWTKSTITAKHYFWTGANDTAKLGRVKLIDLPGFVDLEDTEYYFQGFDEAQGDFLRFIRFNCSIEIWMLNIKKVDGVHMYDDHVDNRQWVLSHTIRFKHLGLSMVDYKALGGSYFYPHGIGINPYNPQEFLLWTLDEILPYDQGSQQIRKVGPSTVDVWPHQFVFYESSIWPSL